MTVGCVSKGMRLVRVECIQYRTLLIGRQQRGGHLVAFALLLRQQLVVVLHDCALHRALQFSGQASLAVIALDSRLFKRRAIDQAIERVVVVATQEYFTSRGRH